MNWKRITGIILLGAGLAVLTLKLIRVYDPAQDLARLSVKANPGINQLVQRVQPDRAVYALLIILPACLGFAFLGLSSKPKSKGNGETANTERPVKPSQRPSGKAAIHSCNVLRFGAEARQLWQFDARNGDFVLNRQQTSLAGEPLPAKIVSKDWRTLFQRKLNVAWLPAEHIFLRVAHFPRSEFKETLSMVELQLEKLSPLPVAQIVWSIQVLPHAEGNMQTVIVMIVAANVVEEFLGELEGQGYLADRLELPLVDQLQATVVTGDGAWIYPEALGGKNTGLAAWWYGGILQNIDLLTLPAADRPAGLKEQLTQMAWAGELEGWLTAPPRWHLVAGPSVAAEWEPVLRAAVDQPVEIVEPVPGPDLAALTARRAAHAEVQTNLMPAEFATRYQQQFIDRLWMRGLLAVGVLYLLGVAIYGTALGFAVYRTTGVEKAGAEISNNYTNTTKLKGLYQVMKDRHELKFAALNCWQKVAELMPETISLESWNFSDGRKLSLNGTVPVSQVGDLRQFEKGMRSQSMFERGRGDDLNYRQSSAGTYSWSFSVELKRGEQP